MNSQQLRPRGVLFAVGSALLFVGVSLAHNLIYFKNFCFPSFDLGIYMEAVQKFSFTHLNPYLSSLGVNFLNDHWHPALVLAKIFTPFFQLSTSLFITELVFTVTLAFLPFLVSKRGYFDSGTAALLSMYLLLNQRQFEATMAFPVHPAVWANALLFFAVVQLIVSSSTTRARTLHSDLLIFGALFLTGFFGEQFSFTLLGYTLVFLVVSPRKKLGIFSLIFSGFWVWFSFSGRAHLIGPILHQSERVATSLASLREKYSWDRRQLVTVAKFFLEASPLVFLGFKFRKTLVINKVQVALVGGIFGPLLLGRVLSNSFGHQYDTLLVCAAAAFAALIFSSVKNIRTGNSALALSLVFFLLCSYSKFERAYGVLTMKKLQNCVHAPQVEIVNSSRIGGLTAAIRQLGVSIDSKNGLASGNLVPNLIQASSPEAHIFTLGIKVEPLPQSDWLMIEHGSCGDPWPWDETKIESFIEEIEIDPAYRVVEKTPCLFFAVRS
jgi:hypothetical protein